MEGNGKSYLDASKERLQKICLKKIDTTMIGALSALEEEFGELLLDIKVRNAYELARARILDNGNTQKRAVIDEFKQYTIEWERYTIVMPVKPRN